MKKIKTLLYEVTPEEVAELPNGYQVLCMDVLLNQFKLMLGGKRPTETGFMKFFIFDLPANVKELKFGAERASP